MAHGRLVQVRRVRCRRLERRGAGAGLRRRMLPVRRERAAAFGVLVCILVGVRLGLEGAAGAAAARLVVVRHDVCVGTVRADVPVARRLASLPEKEHESADQG